MTHFPLELVIGNLKKKKIEKLKFKNMKVVEGIVRLLFYAIN